MRRAILAALALFPFIPSAFAQTLIEPKERKTGSSEFSLTLTTPVHLLYLEVAVVRVDLKVTPEQQRKIDALQNRWADGAKNIDLERGTTGADAATLSIQTHKTLREVLSSDQLKRLDQIILRHREKEHGMPAVLSTVVRDLKLTAEQQERFGVLQRKRADAVLEYLTSDERANAIHRSVHEANTAFVETVDKLLNKEQQTRLKDLLGEPFVGEIKLREPLTISAENEKNHSVYVGPLVDKYGLEAEILKNESVHKELKLTDDQIRKAKEFNVEWWAFYEIRRKKGDSELEAICSLHKYVIFELKEVLTADQIVRFHQIAMQYRKNIAGETAALGHPAARDHRNSDETDQIRSGEPIEKILGKIALLAFRQSLGEPFKGELKINNPLTINRAAPIIKPNVVAPFIETNRVTLAKFMLENSRRYRLDDEQVARLKAIDQDLPKLRQLLHRELSQMPPSTDAGASRTMIPEAKAVEQFKKAIFVQCFEVLDKKQQSLYGAELRAAKASIIEY